MVCKGRLAETKPELYRAYSADHTQNKEIVLVHCIVPVVYCGIYVHCPFMFNVSSLMYFVAMTFKFVHYIS